MPNVDDVDFQKRMVEALLEAYPEDVPATQVRAQTGISASTIGRWRDPGPSYPLREPVKSSLYRWYTDKGRGGATAGSEASAGVGMDPIEDEVRGILRKIRESEASPREYLGALIDAAMLFRARALDRQERTAGTRLHQLDVGGFGPADPGAVRDILISIDGLQRQVDELLRRRGGQEAAEGG